MQRRTFIKQITVTAAAAAGLPISGLAVTRPKYQLRFLRPPGAVPEDDFSAACIGCGQCGEVCPNRCIKYFNFENGLTSLGTPYIIPREKGCTLCMKCGDICPSGAIQPVKYEFDDITSKVKMGRAVVDQNLCLSWQGKTCGVCYRACPLPDVAIRVQRLEQPVVMDDCIGCGLCERSCIQMPQAIRILPNHERS